MLSEEYIAGFFDGEGCVNITVRGKRSNPSLRVYIINTNRKILAMIQKSRWRSGHIYDTKHTNPTWKIGHQLVYHGAEALDFLLMIRRHVVVKKKQIDLAVKFWNWTHRPRNIRCSKHCHPNIQGRVVYKIKPWVFEKDKQFKERMHKLNKKGS